MEDKFNMVMSPTSYKTYKACQRKAYLDRMNTKGNIHFDYGHTYGHAASQLFKRIDDPKEVRLGSAFASIFAYSKNFEMLEDHYSNKTLPMLIQGLQATDFVAQLLKTQYTFVDEEVKVNLKVQAPDGIVYLVSGTYDLRLKNKMTGLYAIMDFKAVAGDYLYSWETDPQVAIYATLNQVVSNKLNLAYEYDAIGKYLVHYTKKKEEVFATRTVDPSFWKFNMPAVIKDFLRSGYEEAVKSNQHRSINELLISTGVNPYLCNNNNYRCGYYARCYNHNFEDNTGVDTRRPSNIITLEVTEEEVMLAAKQISDRVQLAKVEDTSGIMSSEEMDIGFSSISELDLETGGSVTDLLLDAT